MKTYLRKLTTSGSASANQTLTIPKEVSRELNFPERVLVVFDGASLTIRPFEE